MLSSSNFKEEAPPTILRGNASEILALGADDATVGAGSAIEAGLALACKHGCVVVISGEVWG